jgi:hypothetical protein
VSCGDAEGKITVRRLFYKKKKLLTDFCQQFFVMQKE